MSLDDTQRLARRVKPVGAVPCAFPPERLVTGVLTKIERRQDLETVCRLAIRVKDSNACVAIGPRLKIARMRARAPKWGAG